MTRELGRLSGTICQAHSAKLLFFCQHLPPYPSHLVPLRLSAWWSISILPCHATPRLTAEPEGCMLVSALVRASIHTTYRRGWPGYPRPNGSSCHYLILQRPGPWRQFCSVTLHTFAPLGANLIASCSFPALKTSIRSWSGGQRGKRR